MPFFDLGNLLNAAEALLQGRDIYSLPDVYYPVPLYVLFVPLATLPRPFAQIAWTAIEALILVVILRRQALSALLFMPVFLAFLMGQITILMMGLIALLRSRKHGGVALAFLLLKPQLVLFLAPWMIWEWWRRDRRQILWLVLSFGLLFVVAFALQPDWLYRWLSVSGHRMRAPISPSLWGLLSFLPGPAWLAAGGLATAAIVIWAWRRNDFDLIAAAGLLVTPVIISYDLSLLTLLFKDTRAWVALAFVSWLAFVISAWQLNEGVYVILTLSILIRLGQRRLANAATMPAHQKMGAGL